jgi:hypothetical protein
VKALLIITATLALLVPTSAVASSQRQSVTMSGMHPDGWAWTISQAERVAFGWLPVVMHPITCVGIIISGYEASSYSARGPLRYWDKLFCRAQYRVSRPNPSVKTTTTVHVSFVIDVKSGDATSRGQYVIYRLRGITRNMLLPKTGHE